MAAPRKGPLLQLASRFERGRGPGWSQAARQLNKAEFQPSWSPKHKIRDETLRDLYDKPRAGRLSDQKRAARRKEIDAFVRSKRLNTRRLEPLSESQVSRQRAEPPDVQRLQKGTLDQLHIGKWDDGKRHASLKSTDINAVIRQAYATYPGPQDVPLMAHWYTVRALLEVDYDKYPRDGAFVDYVDEAREDDERVYLDNKGRAFVRFYLQLDVTRAQIEAAKRLATADAPLGGTWAARFAEHLFGIGGVTRVMGFSVGPSRGSIIIGGIA